MTRYLKALGLAMMAAFAFRAVAAAGASAQQGVFTTETGTTSVIGKENPEGTNAFTAFGAQTVCPGSEYTANKINTTPHEPVPNGATETTVTPHYKNCENGSGSPRTVNLNSCDYEFYDFTTTGGVPGTYGFLVRIVCDVPGDAIEVEGTAFCPVKVPAQEGLTGLHATNVEGTPDKVRISGEIHNVTATHCIAGHTPSARQHQDVTVEGFDEFEEAKGITISH